MIRSWNFTGSDINRLALKNFQDNVLYSTPLGIGNEVIGRDICKWLYFCKSRSTSWKLTKINTDERYDKIKMSTKRQSNADIFGRDMTSSNFDVMSDNLWHHNSVNIA